MATQVLVNEIIVGELGTDRKTTVSISLDDVRVLGRWFDRRVDDSALIDVLARHPILPVNDTARFSRHWPKGHATPYVTVNIDYADGTSFGYVLYVPWAVVGLRP